MNRQRGNYQSKFFHPASTDNFDTRAKILMPVQNQTSQPITAAEGRHNRSGLPLHFRLPRGLLAWHVRVIHFANQVRPCSAPVPFESDRAVLATAEYLVGLCRSLALRLID